MTVLGGGGPITNPDRASTGYLIRVEGRPRVLADAGGGVYERVGRLGVDLAAIDDVLVTHTHIDHTSDLRRCSSAPG